MATVTLRALSRHYPGAPSAALDGLDLDVRDGELLVLVGPSGCGKSTTLRLIAGLDTPDRGTILIGDRDVSRVPPQERDVAMVFQGYALYPHLRVRDNIAFPLKMRAIPTRERTRKVEEAAEMLGLEKLLDRLPGELSGGERQRVAMGRAIVRSPKVFLFDEPLSNLDAALRAELRVDLAALLRRLRVTSLYVTHDQIEAMTLGDRIAVLRGGKLQQIGPPRAIYENPQNDFVAGFLGSPAMNWIEMTPDGDALRGAGATFPRPAKPLPNTLKAGIRPEHVYFDAPPASKDENTNENETDKLVSIGAKVVTTEPLGAETHVLLDAAGARLWAKRPGFDAPARGEHINVHIQTSALLWFDAETGLRC